MQRSAGILLPISSLPSPYGIELFRAVEQALGKREIIAQDLGYMSETVRQLVRDSGFSGMKVLDKYTELNPHVHFETTPSGWDGYFEKLATDTATGGMADIVQMDYMYISTYAKNGSLADLSSFVSDGTLDISNVDDALADAGTIDGKMVGIPLSTALVSFIYNPAVLEEAGVEAPKNGWTWDDFVSICKTVKEKAGKYGFGGSAFIDTNLLNYWVREYGVSLFAEDNKSLSFDDVQILTDYFQLWKDLIDAGAAPNPDEYEQIATLGYLLLAPWLFGFIFMYVIPAALSIYYSFTDYNLLSAPNWVGLKNYITIFTADEMFRKALAVTFLYVFIMVPLRLAFALFVATLLNKKHMGMAFYRVLYYIPSIVGGSIAVSVVWKQVFGNKGVFMSLLSALGIGQKYSLLGNPKTALLVIVLMGVWQFGSCMLVFLSGLKQIPISLYESASLDGASKFQQFWKITMPMLTPHHLLQPHPADHHWLPGVYRKLRYHQRRPHEQHPDLCTVPVPLGICKLPHGLLLRTGMDPGRPHRHYDPDPVQEPEGLGPLRRLRRVKNGWSEKFQSTIGILPYFLLPAGLYHGVSAAVAADELLQVQRYHVPQCMVPHPVKVGRAHELRLRLAGRCGHPVLALYTEQCHRHGGVGGRHHLLLPAGSLRCFPPEIQGRKLLVRLHRHDYDDPFSGHGGAPVHHPEKAGSLRYAVVHDSAVGVRLRLLHLPDRPVYARHPA